MKNSYRHREYLVAVIRSGVVKLKNVTISPPTFEQTLEAYEIYRNAYEEARSNEIMTHEELENFYNEHKSFFKEFDVNIKVLEDEINQTKEDLFNNYKNAKKLKENKRKLARQKYLLSEIVQKKHELYLNTCENIAEAKRLAWIIQATAKRTSKNFSISDNIESITREYNEFLFDESQIRDLCKNEPWKSLWSVSQKGHVNLFSIPSGVELTFNQKNLLTWSQIYDNVQESLDCPDPEVIQDDDILDGWFIYHHNKRKAEKKRQEILETVGESTKQHDNQFVVVNDKISPSDINSLNDGMAKTILKDRLELINSKGTVKSTEFKDVQEKIRLDIQERIKNSK